MDNNLHSLRLKLQGAFSFIRTSLWPTISLSIYDFCHTKLMLLYLYWKNTYNYDFVSHIGRFCRSRSCPNEANELFLVISNGGIRLQSPITQNQYWLVHELDIRHSSMLNIFSLIIDLGKEKWSEVIFFCDHDHI